MAIIDKLKAIANAIRAKTGKTETMTLVDMPTEISNISGGDDTLGLLLSGNLTTYENNDIETIVYPVFTDCTSLVSCKLGLVQSIPSYTFSNATSLERLDILGGGTLQTRCLEGCVSINTLILRNENKVTSTSTPPLPCFVGEANITRNFTRSQWNTYGTVGRSEMWSGLTQQIKGCITYFIGTVTNEDSKLVWLFGEYTEDYGRRLQTIAFVETEEEANALIETYQQQFAYQNIYVPSALVEQYQNATNWSVYASNFRAIEDYPEICGE